MLAFMTPIKAGKTDSLKNQFFSIDDDYLFSELGIAHYQRWIQQIRDCTYLIHKVEGVDPKNSFEILKNKIAQNDLTATALQSLYNDTLGIDLSQNSLIPNIRRLTKLLSIDSELPKDTPTKEFCFTYPILPSKKEKMLSLYQDSSVYFSPEIQEIFRSKNISKFQLWLQESDKNIHLVGYQEITNPENYPIEEICFSHLTNEHAEITGLSYNELQPLLECLDDHELSSLKD